MFQHERLRGVRNSAVATAIVGTIPAPPTGFVTVIEAWQMFCAPGANTNVEMLIGGGGGILCKKRDIHAAGESSEFNGKGPLLYVDTNGNPISGALSVSVDSPGDNVEKSFAVSYWYMRAQA